MIFSKKRLIDSGLFNGFTDHHSHILHGVDDGVKSIEESMDILNWYNDLGVERVIFTPHIMEDYKHNNAEYLREKFLEFKEVYKGDIELSLAAEYMLDSKFSKHLESDDLLTLWDNYLLVECSFIEAPIQFFETLQTIMQRGYFVVLAHPERYMFLDSADYKRLKEMGVLFQLNILSILGGYGSAIIKRAQSLLDLEYYDLIGSDIHNLKTYSKFINTGKLSKRILCQINAISLD